MSHIMERVKEDVPSLPLRCRLRSGLEHGDAEQLFRVPTSRIVWRVSVGECTGHVAVGGRRREGDFAARSKKAENTSDEGGELAEVVLEELLEHTEWMERGGTSGRYLQARATTEPWGMSVCLSGGSRRGAFLERSSGQLRGAMGQCAQSLGTGQKKKKKHLREPKKK